MSTSSSFSFRSKCFVCWLSREYQMVRFTEFKMSRHQYWSVWKRPRLCFASPFICLIWISQYSVMKLSSWFWHWIHQMFDWRRISTGQKTMFLIDFKLPQGDLCFLTEQMSLTWSVKHLTGLFGLTDPWNSGHGHSTEIYTADKSTLP